MRAIGFVWSSKCSILFSVWRFLLDIWKLVFQSRVILRISLGWISVELLDDLRDELSRFFSIWCLLKLSTSPFLLLNVMKVVRANTEVKLRKLFRGWWILVQNSLHWLDFVWWDAYDRLLVCRNYCNWRKSFQFLKLLKVVFRVTTNSLGSPWVCVEFTSKFETACPLVCHPRRALQLIISQTTFLTVF